MGRISGSDDGKKARWQHWGVVTTPMMEGTLPSFMMCFYGYWWIHPGPIKHQEWPGSNTWSRSWGPVMAWLKHMVQVLGSSNGLAQTHGPGPGVSSGLAQTHGPGPGAQ